MADVLKTSPKSPEKMLAKWEKLWFLGEKNGKKKGKTLVSSCWQVGVLSSFSPPAPGSNLSSLHRENGEFLGRRPGIQGPKIIQVIADDQWENQWFGVQIRKPPIWFTECIPSKRECTAGFLKYQDLLSFIPCFPQKCIL